MSGETPEEMEAKYEGVHAHEISTWISQGIVENVKGFRLIRKLRKQEFDGPTWCSIEVNIWCTRPCVSWSLSPCIDCASLHGLAAVRCALTHFV